MILGLPWKARALSNKPFGQTSSIVLANITTWVLSTHIGGSEKVG